MAGLDRDGPWTRRRADEKSQATGTRAREYSLSRSETDGEAIPLSQALDPNVVRRLAFIRFLYTQGQEQARRPQPLAATALLCFHDAVEMFLLLAAEHLRVSLPRHTTFEGYWDQIAQSGIQLPGRPAMRRMNASRVNFKHHGSIPSAIDLEQFRGDVTTFLTDAAQLVFGAGFHSLDMIDLVTQQGALTRLRDAEAHATQGDYTEALALLSEAFDELLSDYASRKRMSYASTAYSFGPEHGFGVFATHRIPKIDPQFDSHIKAITDAVSQMQRALRVLAVGLDYRRYARFEMLVPHIARFIDGHREVRPVPGLEAGDEEYQFCKQFVIEAALHLAEMDFDLDLHGLWQEHQARQRQEHAARPPAVGS
jgi:hypothetical protein